jgi:hypothetical protein
LGPEEHRAQGSCDRAEFIGARAGGGDVAGGEDDLNVGIEGLCPRDRVLGLGKKAADGRVRSSSVTLCES